MSQITSQAENWLRDVAIANKGGVPSFDRIAFYQSIGAEEAKDWRAQFIKKYREFLSQLKGQPKAPETVVEAEPEPVEEVVKVEEIEKAVEEKKKFHFDIHSILNNETLRWGFGVVALLLAYRDYAYYHQFFSRFDPEHAWISAAIGVATLLMLPVVLIELWSKRKFVAVGVMTLVYLIVLGCSAYITFDSVMSSRQEVVAQQNQGIQSDLRGKAELVQAQKAEKDLEEALKAPLPTATDPNLDTSLDPKSAQFKAMLSKFYKDSRALTVAQAKQDANTAELKKVRARITELLQSVDQTVEVKQTKAEGLDQFMVGAWAVFLDVMGPVSVYVSFFL